MDSNFRYRGRRPASGRSLGPRLDPTRLRGAPSNGCPYSAESVANPSYSHKGYSVRTPGKGAHAGYGKQWIETLKATIEVFPNPFEAPLGALNRGPSGGS
jgi:hypothetical protein